MFLRRRTSQRCRVPVGADKAALRVAGSGVVDEHAGPRARLVRDVGDAAHRADRGRTGRQAVLVGRLGEDVAVAAARIDPADLPMARVPWQSPADRCCRRPCRSRVGAQVRAADAGHQRVGGRPADGRVGDRRRVLHRRLGVVGPAAVSGAGQEVTPLRGRDERVPKVQERLLPPKPSSAVPKSARSPSPGGCRRGTARHSSSAGSPARPAFQRDWW